jgi:hypothetical protein
LLNHPHNTYKASYSSASPPSTAPSSSPPTTPPSSRSTCGCGLGPWNNCPLVTRTSPSTLFLRRWISAISSGVWNLVTLGGGGPRKLWLPGSGGGLLQVLQVLVLGEAGQT